jgi:hypothetical protein
MLSVNNAILVLVLNTLELFEGLIKFCSGFKLNIVWVTILKISNFKNIKI